ncbi:DUF805 domain-containing protein [Shimwellia pseudoproteus]|uniref:DUF805 domain-containing protein n=1 Tax=Shimwellia pseudoproteus TaxID=570012 RepID=UPI0018EA73B0|nr:DUF805 domain-containing protein [Shimwellia pseudoproteus]MBJ3816190.1 DUF805 domain-containing protein [Shimwellia pseudoproteus]
MIRAIRDFFSHYFNWRGRTGRRGYWLFFIASAIAIVVLHLVDTIIIAPLLGFTPEKIRESTSGYPLSFLYVVITFIPCITLSIRRLHDIGKSGWWILLSLVPFVGNLVLLIFACFKSDGDNRYGPPPADGYTTSLV